MNRAMALLAEPPKGRRAAARGGPAAGGRHAPRGPRADHAACRPLRPLRQARQAQRQPAQGGAPETLTLEQAVQLLADARRSWRGRRPAGARRARQGGSAAKTAAPSRRRGSRARRPRRPRPRPPAQALLSVARPRPTPHQRPADPRRRAALHRGQGAGLGRNEILQALARDRGDRAVLKDILRDLADEGEVGRRRRRPSASRRAATVRRARPCSTSPASTHDGDLLLAHPERPELRIVLPVEHLEGSGTGRRRPRPRPPAAGRRGRATRRGRSASCRASRARSWASSRRQATGCASARPTARRGPSSWWPSATWPARSPATWSWPRSGPAAAWASPAPRSRSASAARTTRRRSP